jgi:hypothetical protein
VLHGRNDKSEGMPPPGGLKAEGGPGDDAEPVMTVMMPGED